MSITALECLANENFHGGIRQITKQQAKLIGMPWPLFQGWKEWCGQILLTPTQADEFKLYDREGRRTKMGQPIIPFNQRIAAGKPTNQILSQSFYTSREWRQVSSEARCCDPRRPCNPKKRPSRIGTECGQPTNPM